MFSETLDIKVNLVKYLRLRCRMSGQNRKEETVIEDQWVKCSYSLCSVQRMIPSHNAANQLSQALRTLDPTRFCLHCNKHDHLSQKTPSTSQSSQGGLNLPYSIDDITNFRYVATPVYLSTNITGERT